VLFRSKKVDQSFSYVKFLYYESVNEKDIPEGVNQLIQDGYEGGILRNLHGLYKYKHRSNDLQKYKLFDDEEFKIVGCIESKGTEDGAVVFECLDPVANKVFTVRPRGTIESRREMFTNKDNYIGKSLTVRFQGRDGIIGGLPRFPVGITIRDYE